MIRNRSWWWVALLLCAATASSANAQLAPRPQLSSNLAVGSALRHGELRGIVQDEQGQPIAGAVVSAVGSTSVFAVSGADGRFVFRNLPAGPYLVRAHLQQYLPARGRLVQVAPDSKNTATIALTRRSDGNSSPAVVAASVGAGDDPSSTQPAGAEHGHDEVAWRLRHLKRSVLKDASETVAQTGDEASLFGDSISGLSRAVGHSARIASSFFDDLSLNGQFNLITTTSFDRPQDLFSMNVDVPRSIAYVALEAPGSSGDWTVKGSITQGDVSSWILAGSYVRHVESAHAYEAGVSYAMQQYLGGNGESLAAIRETIRNVGSLYAFDTWTVAPNVRVGYGAKYARYAYLADRGLWSPRASIAFRPSQRDSLTVRATASHREVAPGAEEFLPPSIGPWLPPQRTFSHVAHAAFRPERHDQMEMVVERSWPGSILVGVRAFRQRVDDQVVTVFGVAVADAPAGAGHYQVGSAGDFDAMGWGVSVSRVVGDHVRAAVDYTQARTEWRRWSSDRDVLHVRAPSVLRREDRVHDVTATVESLVTPTATRLFVLYKLNAAFDSERAVGIVSGASTRFDVQVNQSLPFLNFSSAQWEMLVAVSNLFKEDWAETSLYDELFVLHPPKRVLGGVTVRF